MTDLEHRIQQLDRATALEAAQFLAADLGGTTELALPDNEITSDPLAHQEDFENLAKLLLLITSDVDPGAVEIAIDNTGERQFVLGGAELIMLAVLAISGLQVVFSRGRTSEESVTVEERDADGSVRKITTHKSTYGLSGNLGKLLSSILPPRN